MFIGKETEEMLKLGEEGSVYLKKFFFTFHEQYVKYFGKVVLFL
jgi:hypothetical protein